MPKIRQYQPDQVSSQVVGQPKASANVPTLPSSAFESPVVEGALDLANAAAQMKMRVDTTEAEESMVGFERDKNDLFFNPDSGYFNTQGRDAFDGSEGINKSLDELKKKYGDSLSTGARRVFNKTADNHLTRARADVSRHASKGFKAWEVSTLNSQVENTIENSFLYWNDTDRLRVQNALGRQAILDSSKLEGIGPESTNERLQTFNSSFYEGVIRAATTENATQGREMFDKHSNDLEGPSKIKLDNLIKSKEKSEKTQSDAVAAVSNATSLVDQHADRNTIRDEVNKIEDPGLRKKTMDESMRQFSMKKKAESEAQGDAFERAESHLFDSGSAETFKAQRPDDWELLSASQKRKIQSGALVSTDWNVFSDLMTLPKAKLSEVNPADHFADLASAERSKLVSAVRSARGIGSASQKIDHQVGRTRNSQTTAVVEQILGKKSKWNDDKRDQANLFYSLLDDEIAHREQLKGNPLDSKEFTEALSDLTRKVTIERSFLGFDLLASDVEQSVTDIDPVDLKVLTKFLRDNNVPVTADNLFKAQRQATN